MTQAYDARTVEAAFQRRVDDWLLACFGDEIARDRTERNHSFLEEALELVQACGCTASEAHQLVDYTFGRPIGEIGQEVGGVMNTLAALCLAYGHDMLVDGNAEMDRCWVKIDRIREKQRNKPKHSPLPVSPGTTTGEASEREISDSRHAALYPNTPPPSLEAVVASYWDAHEDAREMGYPSMTEALEALSEFREEQGPTPSGALGETVEKLRTSEVRPFPPMLPGESIEISASEAATVNRHCVAMKAEIERLTTLLTALEQRRDGWLPIENIPDDVLEALLYWPALKLDEDDNLTDEPAGVPGLVGRGTRFSAKHGWDECEAELGASGHYFGDPWEFGHPTHWRPLPTPPLPMKED